MPPPNRARNYGNGGLGALLAGVFDYLGATGVAQNPTRVTGEGLGGELGPPTAQQLEQARSPFVAKNFFAKPNVNQLNNQYLMDVMADERQFGNQSALAKLQTDEGLRARKEGLQYLRPEAYELNSGTNQANFEHTQRMLPIERQKADEAQARQVMSDRKLIALPDNIKAYDEQLRDPMLARMLQEETTGTARSMEEFEEIGRRGRSSQIAEPDMLDIAVQERNLRKQQIGSEMEILPSATSRAIKSNQLAPEIMLGEASKARLMNVPEGVSVVDTVTGKPRLSNVNPLQQQMAERMRQSMGGESQSPSATGEPQSSSDIYVDKRTGELVNLVTGERVNLKSLFTK